MVVDERFPSFKTILPNGLIWSESLSSLFICSDPKRLPWMVCHR